MSGFIHTLDPAKLGFTPPGELDPSTTNIVQNQVITLLNTSIQSSSFVKLP